MEKIKILLLSLALFALVGAALAFKAKIQSQFCTGEAPPDQNCRDVACPNRSIGTFGLPNQAPFVCTTTYDGNDCNTPGLKCTTTSRPLVEDL